MAKKQDESFSPSQTELISLQTELSTSLKTSCSDLRLPSIHIKSGKRQENNGNWKRKIETIERSNVSKLEGNM